MALINRISRLFKADFHAVLDQIEEPEMLLKQAIREMEDDLAETEQRIRVCAHEQEALATRNSEVDNKLAVDFRFASRQRFLVLCADPDALVGFGQIVFHLPNRLLEQHLGLFDPIQNGMKIRLE